MNDDQVLEQLSQTDIFAPDTVMPALAWSRDTALSEIERRMGMEPRKTAGESTSKSDAQQREDMARPSVTGQVVETRRKRPESGRRSKRALVGAAAFATVLVAAAATFGIVAWLGDDEPGIPVLAIPVAGISDDPGAREAFKAIEVAYAAFNSGDIETWVTARDAPYRGEKPEYTEALFAADARTEVSGCVSHGFGDWEGNVTGYRFTCEATEINAFYAPGGLDPRLTYEWFVADGEVVRAGSNEPGFDDWLAFNTDFRNWMRVTHPEVYAGMRFLSLTTDFPAAESMPTALQYVDAFVADSPDWPKSPGS